MGYDNGDLMKLIREDLKQTEGHRELVKAGWLETKMVKAVPPSMLHVNPDDEFSMPEVGPNRAIVENYSQIARKNYSMGYPVFEEAIIVNKMRQGGYLILNGHHRWAGAMKARVPKVRILAVNSGV